MATAARTKAARGQAQPTFKPNAFRVTKSAKLNVQSQHSRQKLEAIEEIICPKERPQVKQISKKRRHDALESDCENEEATISKRTIKKARATKLTDADSAQQSKLQLHTPPPSSPESESLPAALEELSSLHKAFTQALAVHYAYNSRRNGISLAELVPAMTRLWKRRTVSQQDIQRMLAIWEIRVDDGHRLDRDIDHKDGPYRLLLVGIGASSHTKVECAWTESSAVTENELHSRFVSLIEKLHKSRKNSNLSPTFDTYDSLPSLRIQTGTQTQARKEKINSIRDQILRKPPQIALPTQPQSLDISSLDISDPLEPKASPRETQLKSRTLSLFDRLRAKQMANPNSSVPTSQDLLRKRALHRIADIIDILRLKQARKLSSQLRIGVHASPSISTTSTMKVSFSLDALVQEIRDSGKTNIAAEEIKECILILGCEVPDAWCNVYSTGEVKCVTLQGEGWRKEEVKEWCEKEISRIGK